MSLNLFWDVFFLMLLVQAIKDGRENECQGLQIPEVDAEIAKLISMFSTLKSSKKKATLQKDGNSIQLL
jgi:hypothetical protein